jgi:hypothetical protein
MIYKDCLGLVEDVTRFLAFEKVVLKVERYRPYASSSTL